MNISFQIMTGTIECPNQDSNKGNSCQELGALFTMKNNIDQTRDIWDEKRGSMVFVLKESYN